MKRLNLIISLFAILTFLCTNLLFAYHVKISPVNQENYYEMRIGDVVTFTASGMDWDDENKAIIYNAQVTDVVWEFDKSVLEEIDRTQNTITLKAIGKKITTLKVKAKVSGHPIEETIGVVIR